MSTTPIVFAFDHNMVNPATICISSLMMNAKSSTFYDIFILYPENDSLDRSELDKIPTFYPNCKISYRPVGQEFNNAFEIRGVTTPTYYRLLIPELIPEYDKIIYSDVDVVFRSDLTNIYNNTDLSDRYVAGVNSVSDLIPGYKKYYSEKLHLNPSEIIYAGNLIINSALLRRDNVVAEFKKLAKNNYTYQDMDIINIACRDKIKQLPPSFCLTNYITELAVKDPASLGSLWSGQELEEALKSGIVHYNGQKPWKGFCVNFDIWWEYYRKSPFFNKQFYFDFFNNRVNELDRLPLWKRIKILARWFLIR